MEDIKINLRLIGEEAKAFERLSTSELRKPSAQARFIIRRELERLGLIEPARPAPVAYGAQGES